MQTSHRLTMICVALALGTVAYVGIGYHRLSVACYESRHSIGREPMVAGGVFGAVVDGLLWPVFLATTTSDISCLPRSLGE